MNDKPEGSEEKLLPVQAYDLQLWKKHGGTDLPLVEKWSEDWSYAVAKQLDRYSFAVTADGLSGNDTGHIASRMAVTAVTHYLLAALQPSYKNMPSSETASAIEQIRDHTHFKDKLKGGLVNCVTSLIDNGEFKKTSGTTLDVMVVDRKEKKAYLFHIGDGYIYLIKPDGTLVQQTTAEIVPETGGPRYFLGRDKSYGEHEFYEAALGSDSNLTYTGALLCTDGFYHLLVKNGFVEHKLTKPDRLPPALVHHACVEEMEEHKHQIWSHFIDLPGRDDIFQKITENYPGVIKNTDPGKKVSDVTNYLKENESSDDAVRRQKADNLRKFIETTAKKQIDEKTKSKTQQRDDATAVLLDFKDGVGELAEEFDLVGAGYRNLLLEEYAVVAERDGLQTDKKQLTDDLAAKVEEYSELDERYNGVVTERDGLQERLTTKESEYDTLVIAKAEVVAERDGLQTAKDELATNLAAKVAAYQELEGTHTTVVAERDGLQERLTAKNGEYDALAIAKAEIVTERDGLQTAKDTLETELAANVAAYQELDGKHTAVVAKRDELQTTKGKLETGLATKVEEYKTVVAERDGLQQDFYRLHREHGTCAGILDAKAETIEALRSEGYTLKSQLATKEGEYDSSVAERDKLQGAKDKLKTDLAAKVADYDAVVAERDELKNRFDAEKEGYDERLAAMSGRIDELYRMCPDSEKDESPLSSDEKIEKIKEFTEQSIRLRKEKMVKSGISRTTIVDIKSGKSW